MDKQMWYMHTTEYSVIKKEMNYQATNTNMYIYGETLKAYC